MNGLGTEHGTDMGIDTTLSVEKLNITVMNILYKSIYYLSKVLCLQGATRRFSKSLELEG